MRLHYHPGKDNVVAHALSCKSYVNTLITGRLPQELADDLRGLHYAQHQHGANNMHKQDNARYNYEDEDLNMVREQIEQGVKILMT